MISHNIKVIILSQDNNYKNLLSRELRNEGDLDVISTPLNLSQAYPFLINTPNCALIIDVLTIQLTEENVKAMLKQFKITIIIAGHSTQVNFANIGISNVIHKPIGDNKVAWGVYSRDVVRRIKTSPHYMQKTAGMGLQSDGAFVDDFKHIIAIASSTGGTEALVGILTKLPPNMPAILIVQHMPSGFTKLFAERLDKLCKIKVKEAENGEFLRMGTAYIAPGDLHMRLCKISSKYGVETFFGEKSNGVRPAADITFASIAKIADCKRIVGVVLTGMGADGAKGLYELHAKGTKVIAQNKETCVVFGMPKVTIDMGAADFILPLDAIADKLIQLTV